MLTALVVEDDVMVREALAWMLARLGFRTVEAAHGDAAAEMLRSGDQVDLILSDVVMPGKLCGRQLAELARELRPAIRVLLITGYTAESRHVGAARDAGEVLLAKPITCARLGSAIADAFDTPMLPRGAAAEQDLASFPLRA
jgi:CheY-like chemotaxis protein